MAGGYARRDQFISLSRAPRRCAQPLWRSLIHPECTKLRHAMTAQFAVAAARSDSGVSQ